MKQRTFTMLFIPILIVVACSSLMATPIKKILEHPRDYNGKVVTVSGQVTEIFSFFVIKYFTVRDDTGEIIVVTHRPLPHTGTKITVKGTVQEAFSLGQNQLIVIIEDDGK